MKSASLSSWYLAIMQYDGYLAVVHGQQEVTCDRPLGTSLPSLRGSLSPSTYMLEYFSFPMPTDCENTTPL